MWKKKNKSWASNWISEIFLPSLGPDRQFLLSKENERLTLVSTSKGQLVSDAFKIGFSVDILEEAKKEKNEIEYL